MKTAYAYDDMCVDIDIVYEDYGPTLKLDIFTYAEDANPRAKLEGHLRFDRTGALLLREMVEQFLAELDGCQ